MPCLITTGFGTKCIQNATSLFFPAGEGIGCIVGEIWGVSAFLFVI